MLASASEFPTHISVQDVKQYKNDNNRCKEKEKVKNKSDNPYH